MDTSLIEKALTTADETRAIDMGENAVDRTGELFARLFPGKKAIVVADGNTWEAAGQPVVDSLTRAGVEQVPAYVFPGKPTLYAGYENVEVLREHLRPLGDDVIACSIASGTLNDLAKLASGELGREYMNVCTAASVDGFAAFGASIAVDGFKATRSCPAPAGLIADLDVIAAAPKRLTATGYGDLIEKVPAGADWIAADELGIEPIDDYVWSLVQGPLRATLDDAEGVGAGDREAIARLAEANIMSGLAMQAAKSSRPASGAGHQFSHVWEMEGHGLDWDPPLSHGFKVGVGTVASCAIWQAVLAYDVAGVDVDAAVAAHPSAEAVEAQVRSLFSERIADEAVKSTLAKYLSGDELRARILAIQEAWPRIAARVADQLMSPDEVVGKLNTVGAPSHPEMIRIDWDRFRQTHYKAGMIRPRYTILDVMADLGITDHIVDGLFADDGYWGRHRHPQA